MIATLYFDGSHRQKQIHGGFVALVFTQPVIIGAGCSSQTGFSSNDAEWYSLMIGLEWVTKIRGLEVVNIRGDCTSVLETLKPDIKSAKNGGRFRTRCMDLLTKYKIRWTTDKISRNQNSNAHKLSRGHDLAFSLEVHKHTNHSKSNLLHILAAALWRDAGCPSGRDIEFWVRAESMFNESVTPALIEKAKLIEEQT